MHCKIVLKSDSYVLYENEWATMGTSLPMHVVEASPEYFNSFLRKFFTYPKSVRRKLNRYKVSNLKQLEYILDVWKLSEENSVTLDYIDKRGREFVLDHIVPIVYGYNTNIPIEQIASAENLRIIPVRDNLYKASNLFKESRDVLAKWGYEVNEDKKLIKAYL